MMNLKEKGRGYLRIANTLNNLKVPTKRGGKWYPMTVKQILDRAKSE